MTHSSLVRRGVVVVIAGCGLIACSGSDTSSAPATLPATTVASTTATPTTATPTTATPTTAALTTVAPTTSTLPGLTDLRGTRYCEVLLLMPDGEGAQATVFGTQGLSDCPAEQFATLDAAAIAAENKVPIAFLNGPRYWTIDAVRKRRNGERVQQTFGSLLMNRLATVKIVSRADAVLPYVASAVLRSAVMTFEAGSEIYELTDATGKRYVMQSWSQQVDPALAEADLPGLGARLQLPEGWSYASRTLTEPMEVVTLDEPAFVLQDELRNSYSMETEG